MISRILVKLGLMFFSINDLQNAYQHYAGLPVILGRRATVAYWLMKVVSVFIPLERLRKVVGSRRDVVHGYGKIHLDLQTHRIFDLPDIVISKNRPRTINVLVPAFSTDTISAGFFGVFAFAMFCAECGFHTRLVLFENFHFDLETFRTNLKKFPIFSKMLDKVEITYIGSRYEPLAVSDQDIAVATVWYSAYLAEKIRKFCGAKHFLYLVQDYEPAFHPVNSNFVLAHNSYKFPAIPWFSTRPLQQYFMGRELYSGQEWNNWCVYNNACSASFDTRASIEEKRTSIERNFVFYSRPEVNRNLFHLGALAIITAYQNGVFDDGSNWNFYGIGIGNVEVYLDSARKLSQLPRMSLEDYQKTIGRFDLGLSLMGSPHPSIVPFDLAASGALVVTNSFETKTSEYFAGISANVLCKEPTLTALVEGIEEAVKRCKDFDARLMASRINYPRDWSETWTQQHRDFLRASLSDAFEGTHALSGAK